MCLCTPRNKPLFVLMLSQHCGWWASIKSALVQVWVLAINEYNIYHNSDKIHKHWLYGVLMLLRYSNIKTTLGQRIVFVGLVDTRNITIERNTLSLGCISHYSLWFIIYCGENHSPDKQIGQCWLKVNRPFRTLAQQCHNIGPLAWV